MCPASPLTPLEVHQLQQRRQLVFPLLRLWSGHKSSSSIAGRVQSCIIWTCSPSVLKEAASMHIRTCQQSTILWNVAGAPCRPNGMRLKPNGVVNAVFSWSHSATGTCQYPFIRSRVVIKGALPTHHPPLALDTEKYSDSQHKDDGTSGNAQLFLERSMIPCASISSISHFTWSRSACERRYGGRRMGAASPIEILCSVIVV